MKKKHLLYFFLVVIVIIATISNPSENRHKETLREVIKEKLKKELQTKEDNSDGRNIIETLSSGLGSAFSGMLLDSVLKNLVSVDNYVLFSLTKINWEGKERTIGVGIFGNVYFSSNTSRFLEKTLN